MTVYDKVKDSALTRDQTIIIVIWCSIDSGHVDGFSTPYQSPAIEVYHHNRLPLP